VPLLLIFIGLPILELLVLFKVHGVVGTMTTIGMVIFTAVAGVWLLKQQGFSMLARYQSTILSGKMPAQEMLEGVALVFGGALLLTPGFVTDTIGFLCLLPFTRQPIVKWLMGRFGRYVRAKTSFVQPQQGRVIDDPSQTRDDQHNKP